MQVPCQVKDWLISLIYRRLEDTNLFTGYQRREHGVGPMTGVSILVDTYSYSGFQINNSISGSTAAPGSCVVRDRPNGESSLRFTSDDADLFTRKLIDQTLGNSEVILQNRNRIAAQPVGQGDFLIFAAIEQNQQF